jgi:hypothetical protein
MVDIGWHGDRKLQLHVCGAVIGGERTAGPNVDEEQARQQLIRRELQIQNGTVYSERNKDTPDEEIYDD